MPTLHNWMSLAAPPDWPCRNKAVATGTNKVYAAITCFFIFRTHYVVVMCVTKYVTKFRPSNSDTLRMLDDVLRMLGDVLRMKDYPK